MSDVKPMLAHSKSPDPATLTYPLIVQPKLDGIRCMIVDGKALSRTLKPIPNAEIRKYLERPEFEGLDGELLVGDPTDPNAMQNTSTVVMSKSKPAGDWHFYVFDDVAAEGLVYRDRYANLEARGRAAHVALADSEMRVELVLNFTAHTVAEVEAEEQSALDEGYEGVILRDPAGLYKYGRSGKKGPLLKLKRFIDYEAKITGVFEEMHNTNEKVTNELGRGARSSAKDGLVGKDTLGGFIVEAINGPHEGCRFRVGSGFTAEQRRSLWESHNTTDRDGNPDGLFDLRGRTIKVKSFPVGVKEKPRHPIFLGFRDLEAGE